MPDLANLISFTSAGLTIANFVEIREALIQKYKDVYGSDIDLSTGSADGVFVNEVSLLINNILQSCLTAYSNLDVNEAQGVYLDALCALSNVYRKQATRSTASITVTNIGNSNLVLDNPEFVDKEGTIWAYSGTISLTTTAPGDSVSIIVTCRDVGPIQAQAGWIEKTIDLQPVQITQTQDAIPGHNIESDADLRARRAQSSAAVGTTTLESVIGALLEVDGIIDVKIFNNNSDSQVQISGDNTNVDAHAVYIAIHKNPNLTIEDETIGSIIHQKLTPGVRTQQSSSLVGTPKSWQFIDTVYGVQVVESTENIYWKECAGIHTNLVISLDNLYKFNENTCDLIGANVISYVNSLPIGTTIYQDRYQNEIANIIWNSDPGYRGQHTFWIDNLSISSSLNPWAYYDYSNIAKVAVHEDNDPDKPIVGYTITLS